MMKFINIIIFFLLISFSSASLAQDTKPDCSMHSTKTWMGLTDKINCKKGLKVPVREKAKYWKDLNPFKKKVKEVKKLNLTGIMFWRLAGDLPIEHEKSLLRAINKELKS